MEIKFDSYTESNSVGFAHEENQDSYLVDDRLLVLAVADGVGGYAGAKQASSLAVEALKDPKEPIDNEESLKRIVLDIHKQIEKRAQRLGYFGMGTTIALAKLVDTPEPHKVITANVGDSPILLFKQRNLSATPLYQDDSMRYSDPQNMWGIVQYLGFEEGVNVHTKSGDWETGDVLMLCSDGVTDNLYGSEVEKEKLRNLVLNEKSAKKIVEAAIQKGIKNDDMTVVLAFYL